MASHSTENMSRSMLLHGVLFAITAVNITHIIGNILARYALDFGIARPASRQQESEADYIGLMLMAQACYDPKAAVGFWRRMQRIEKEGGGSPAEFMSTHPSVSLNILTRTTCCCWFSNLDVA